MSQCDTCVNYFYDEDDEGYFCSVDMDEDDVYRLMTFKSHSSCPYYRVDDEYAVVKHQM